MREKAAVELIFIGRGPKNKAGHNYALAKTVVRGFGAGGDCDASCGRAIASSGGASTRICRCPAQGGGAGNAAALARFRLHGAASAE